MPTTTNFGFRKPSPTDAPDGPSQIGALGDDIDVWGKAVALQSPTYTGGTGWVNSGAGTRFARNSGIGSVRMDCTNPGARSAGEVLFTLPAGYRPSEVWLLVPVDLAHGSIGIIMNILTNGGVQLAGNVSAGARLIGHVSFPLA